ncbi:anti-sigma factor domain-containing protein [Paenibacillus solisilvae]|uniref:Regulator of SigK n=1 Tax=Paenibacillus solisilvae TaxID=2486751 RepID=A0ABW0W787_9BACL
MTASAKHFCDEAAMYVLGGMNNHERELFEVHLEHCHPCQEYLAELKDIVDAIPLAVEDTAPPVGMKSRILKHVLQSEDPHLSSNQLTGVAASNQETRQHEDIFKPVKRNKSAFALGAASVIFLVMTGMLALKNNGLNMEKNSLLTEVTKLQHDLAVKGNPVTALRINNVVQLSPKAKDIVAQGLATIVIDDKGMHLIVQTEKLPALKKEEAFQVWLLKSGKPVNAGTFISQDGSGALYYTFTPGDYDSIAITQEPDAYGQEPRGSVVLAADFVSSTASDGSSNPGT